MRTLAILLAAAPLAGQPPATAPARLLARVDPRVELMSLIFRLAGNPEYNMPNSRSAYAAAAEKHFGPHRDHAVVAAARRLRRERGVGYDAVMSLAVHVTAPPELREKIPFDQKPARLDGRWRLDEARAFLAEARRFVAETGFADFLEEQKKPHAAAGDRLTAELDRLDCRGWLDAFFGARPGARFEVLVGLLNGGGCYGVGVRHAGAPEEITPVIGVPYWDAEGLPLFGSWVEGTVVHELCHSYVNPVVDRHLGRLEPAASRLFAGVADQMRRQAYGSWQTMMYETLVRACTLCYLRARRGEERAAAAAREEAGRGFAWVGPLAVLLQGYEGSRRDYPDLDAYMPRVAEFLEEYAAAHQPRRDQAREAPVPGTGRRRP